MLRLAGLEPTASPALGRSFSPSEPCVPHIAETPYARHFTGFGKHPGPRCFFQEVHGHPYPFRAQRFLERLATTAPLPFSSPGETQGHRLCYCTRRGYGAVDGNRTRTLCLEGRHATVTSLLHIGPAGRNCTPHYPVLSQTFLYGRRHRQSSSTHSDR